MNYDTFQTAFKNVRRHTYSLYDVEITLYEDTNTRMFDGMLEVNLNGMSLDFNVDELGKHESPKEAAKKLLSMLKCFSNSTTKHFK